MRIKLRIFLLRKKEEKFLTVFTCLPRYNLHRITDSRVYVFVTFHNVVMKRISRHFSFSLAAFSLMGLSPLPFTLATAQAQTIAAQNSSALAERATRLYGHDNLMAWCVVPFDGAKRGPKERAKMLQNLGIKSLVYDYRAEHIPQWEEEMIQLKAHEIQLRGWWFPRTLNEEAKEIIALIEKHEGKQCDLWVTGSGDEVKPDQVQERLIQEVERLKPIALEAKRIGVRVGLYNHGGWFGRPETQLMIIQRLKAEGLDNVGMVYNLHHGHGDMDRIEKLWPKMLPHLLAVNLNGMDSRLDDPNRKILPIGEGSLDLAILKGLLNSSYQGPIGILNHTNEDAEVRLRQNMQGLARLVKQLSISEPVSFKPEKAPLDPESWPYWDHFVNRDRVFDFYTKQALHFKVQKPMPALVSAAPELDSGIYGHWGNQTEKTWQDDRWSKQKLGNRFALPALADGLQIPKAVAVRLGEQGELSAVFDPISASFPMIRKNGFVDVNDVRHGFMGGVTLGGEKVSSESPKPMEGDYRYAGFYRFHDRTVFAYDIEGKRYLDSAWALDGKLVREKTVEKDHSFFQKIREKQFSSQYKDWITLKGSKGEGYPFAVDRLPLPSDLHPEVLCFLTSFDFFEDGRAVVATMTGDIWLVDGIDDSLQQVRWKQIASGLHQPMGVRIVRGEIHVLGRDQITKLVDLNGDFEADFYECVTNAYKTSPGGHDYVTGLEYNGDGYFYFASGTEGVCRIKPGDKQEEVLATGFRNPNQIGLSKLGEVTVGLQEGDWVPASGIAYIQKGQHYGYRGALGDKPITEPMLYLPRLEDNSSGGQTWIDSPKWKAFHGNWIHYAMGGGSAYLVMTQKVGDKVQGAGVRFAGGFESGIHTGRFHPKDHELYVIGMNGWGTYTPKDGAFQRVRYTGQRNLPTGFEVRENGVLLKFDQELDASVVQSTAKHFAQVWNYRFGPAYGSLEYSVLYPHQPGHDVLAIENAYLLPDKKSLFLEISELPVADLLHLQVQLGKGEKDVMDYFITVHDFAPAFTEYPDYVKKPKTRFVGAENLGSEVAQKFRPNPWTQDLGGRVLEVEAALGLQFNPKVLKVKGGEKIRLKFKNPDLIPHNWVLLAPDAENEVGNLSNLMISQADAVFKHYVPDSPKVLFYTDMVDAQKSFEIHFEVPKQVGNYPYICTFPGHWMVMKGILQVEP